MKLTTKQLAAKEDFIKALGLLATRMKALIETGDQQWSIKGFIDTLGNVYPISSDTKIVSKLLEIQLFPVLFEFAESYGFSIVEAAKQNWYPDFSFVSKDDPSIKFAVDLKTTYRDQSQPDHVNGFTLGSHGEYFRNRTSEKNIQFPYSQYLAHICLGIIYSRSTELSDRVHTVVECSEDNEQVTGCFIQSASKITSIQSVISAFDFFVVEKWKISSDYQGSSNTANIGSITDISDIKNGRGIFAELGEDVFDDYWINYKVGGYTTIKKYCEIKGLDYALLIKRNNKKSRKTK